MPSIPPHPDPSTDPDGPHIGDAPVAAPVLPPVRPPALLKTQPKSPMRPPVWHPPKASLAPPPNSLRRAPVAEAANLALVNLEAKRLRARTFATIPNSGASKRKTDYLSEIMQSMPASAAKHYEEGDAPVAAPVLPPVRPPALLKTQPKSPMRPPVRHPPKANLAPPPSSLQRPSSKFPMPKLDFEPGNPIMAPFQAKLVLPVAIPTKAAPPVGVDTEIMPKKTPRPMWEKLAITVAPAAVPAKAAPVAGAPTLPLRPEPRILDLDDL